MEIKPFIDPYAVHVSVLVEARLRRGETQTEFWGRLGVSQSSSSRYEASERPVPMSVLIAATFIYFDDLTAGIMGQDSCREHRRYGSSDFFIPVPCTTVYRDSCVLVFPDGEATGGINVVLDE